MAFVSNPHTSTLPLLGRAYPPSIDAMSSLADELLADLDGLSGDEEQYDEEPQPEASTSASAGVKRKAPVGSDDEMSDGEGGDEGDDDKAVGGLA